MKTWLDKLLMTLSIVGSVLAILIMLVVLLVLVRGLL